MNRQAIKEIADNFRSGALSADELGPALIEALRRDTDALPFARHAVDGLVEEGKLTPGAASALVQALEQAGETDPDQTVARPQDATVLGAQTAVDVRAPTQAVGRTVTRSPTVASDQTVRQESDATVTKTRPNANETVPAKRHSTVGGNVTAVGNQASIHGNARAGTGSTGSDWSDPSGWLPTHEGPVGPGTVIKERYVVEAQLGEGGMGTVFKVRDLVHEAASDRDPHVAMKVLSESFRRHPDSLKALHRETRKTQTLAHPNIITVYHFDRDGTTIFMTMELLDGKPLDEVIDACAMTGLPAEEATPIIEQMAAGLSYAHERGFVHADFKPGNVFYCTNKRVKVLDFGIARPARIAGNDNSDKTQFDVHSLGAMTPGYASLEMLDGRHPAPPDDVYALGCVAYQLYTGRHPFDRKRASVAREENLTPTPIHGLPRRQRKTIERALRFDRADRFADAGEFLKAFQGPRPVQRWAVAALLFLTLMSAGLGVRQIWFNDSTVEFADLPPDDQRQIRQLEGPAEEAFELAKDMQVYRNEAMDYYLRILNIHADNEIANERVEYLVTQWSEDAREMKARGDDVAARRLLIGLFNAYPVLNNHERLGELAQSLDITLPIGK